MKTSYCVLKALVIVVFWFTILVKNFNEIHTSACQEKAIDFEMIHIVLIFIPLLVL